MVARIPSEASRRFMLFLGLSPNTKKDAEKFTRIKSRLRSIAGDYLQAGLPGSKQTTERWNTFCGKVSEEFPIFAISTRGLRLMKQYIYRTLSNRNYQVRQQRATRSRSPKRQPPRPRTPVKTFAVVIERQSKRGIRRPMVPTPLPVASQQTSSAALQANESEPMPWSRGSTLVAHRTSSAIRRLHGNASQTPEPMQVSQRLALRGDILEPELLPRGYAVSESHQTRSMTVEADVVPRPSAQTQEPKPTRRLGGDNIADPDAITRFLAKAEPNLEYLTPMMIAAGVRNQASLDGLQVWEQAERMIFWGRLVDDGLTKFEAAALDRVLCRCALASSSRS